MAARGTPADVAEDTEEACKAEDTGVDKVVGTVILAAEGREEEEMEVSGQEDAAGKGGMEDMAAATGREGGEGKLEAQGRVDVPAGDECKEEVAPEDYREVWEEVEAAGEEEMAEMEVGWASMAVSAGMGDMDRVLRVVRVAPTSTGRIAADTSGGSNCSSCSSCSRFYDYDVRRCRACTSRNIHLA